jgi:hypothetical protein
MKAQYFLAGLLGLAAVTGLPRPARADNIDEALLEEAASLLEELQAPKYKYQNVGVLKFRVKKGDQEPGFDAGLLNANMATRLENALILANDVKKPLGIVRVGNAAARRLAPLGPDASYLKPEARKELFAGEYPLAWGGRKVSVDAFLTGQVILAKDFKRTTVVIEVFDRNAGLRKLAEFSVKTDRSILADTSESFSLVRRGAGVVRRGDEEDELANAASAAHYLNPKVEENILDDVLDIGIFYGKEKQTVKPSRDGLERMVAEPKDGDEVTFEIRNKTADKLGVVFRINGVNTLHKEGPGRQIDQHTRWILDPKTSYTIRGFYPEGGGLQKFVVKSPRGLPDLDPDKLGLIEVDVFRAGGLADDPSARFRNVNLRSLPQLDKDPETVADLKSALRRAVNLKGTTARGAILAGETVDNVKVLKESLDNPVHVGSAVIRYFR